MIYRQLEKANKQSGAFNHVTPRFSSKKDADKEVVGTKWNRVTLPNLFESFERSSAGSIFGRLGSSQARTNGVSPFEGFISDRDETRQEHPPKRRMLQYTWYTCHCVLGYRLKRDFDWSEEDRFRCHFEIVLRQVIAKMECLSLGTFPIRPTTR